MTTLTAPKKTAELPQYGSPQYDSMLNQCEKTQKHAPAQPLQPSAAVCRLPSAVSKCRLPSAVSKCRLPSAVSKCRLPSAVFTLVAALLFCLLFGEAVLAQSANIPNARTFTGTTGSATQNTSQGYSWTGTYYQYWASSSWTYNTGTQGNHSPSGNWWGLTDGRAGVNVIALLSNARSNGGTITVTDLDRHTRTHRWIDTYNSGSNSSYATWPAISWSQIRSSAALGTGSAANWTVWSIRDHRFGGNGTNWTNGVPTANTYRNVSVDTGQVTRLVTQVDPKTAVGTVTNTGYSINSGPANLHTTNTSAEPKPAYYATPNTGASSDAAGTIDNGRFRINSMVRTWGGTLSLEISDLIIDNFWGRGTGTATETNADGTGSQTLNNLGGVLRISEAAAGNTLRHGTLRSATANLAGGTNLTGQLSGTAQRQHFLNATSGFSVESASTDRVGIEGTYYDYEGWGSFFWHITGNLGSIDDSTTGGSGELLGGFNSVAYMTVDGSAALNAVTNIGITGALDQGNWLGELTMQSGAWLNVAGGTQVGTTAGTHIFNVRADGGFDSTGVFSVGTTNNQTTNYVNYVWGIDPVHNTRHDFRTRSGTVLGQTAGSLSTVANFSDTGTGSLVNSGGVYHVGESGSGTLNLFTGIAGYYDTDAARAGILTTSGGNVVFGVNAGSQGTGNIYGTGSRLQITSDHMIVGQGAATGAAARGNLYVNRGAMVNVGYNAAGTAVTTTQNLTIAEAAASYGRAHFDGYDVHGNHTRGNISGTLTVGQSGKAGQLYQYVPFQVQSPVSHDPNAYTPVKPQPIVEPDDSGLGVNRYVLAAQGTDVIARQSGYDWHYAGHSITDGVGIVNWAQVGGGNPVTRGASLWFDGNRNNPDDDNNLNLGTSSDNLWVTSDLATNLADTNLYPRSVGQQNAPGLAITAGAQVRSGTGMVAENTNSIGYVVIDGTGSYRSFAVDPVNPDLNRSHTRWDIIGIAGDTNSGTLTVAKEGNAYVRVLGGAELTVLRDMDVAMGLGNEGTVRVSGVGSKLIIGRGGSGNLTVSGGGGTGASAAQTSTGNMYLYDGALMTVAGNYILGDTRGSVARQHVDGVNQIEGIRTRLTVDGALTVGRNGAAAGWYQENRYDHENWTDDGRFDHYYQADPQVWFDSLNTLENIGSAESARTGGSTGNTPGLAITRGAYVQSRSGMVGQGSAPRFNPEATNPGNGFMSNGYVLIDHKNYNDPANRDIRMNLFGARTEWIVQEDLTIAQDGVGFVRVLNGGHLNVGSLRGTSMGRTVIGSGTHAFRNEVSSIADDPDFLKGHGTLHVIGNDVMPYYNPGYVLNTRDNIWYWQGDYIVTRDGDQFFPVYQQYATNGTFHARHQPVMMITEGTWESRDFVANLIDPSTLMSHRDLLGYITPHGYFVANPEFGARSEWFSSGATVLGAGADPRNTHYMPSRGTIRINDGGYGETYGLYVGLEEGTEGEVSVQGRGSELHIFPVRSYENDRASGGLLGRKPEGQSLFSASNHSLVWLHGNAELNLNGNAMISKGAILHLDSMLNLSIRNVEFFRDGTRNPNFDPTLPLYSPVIFDAMTDKVTFVDSRIEGDGIVTGENGVFITQTREGMGEGLRMEIEPGQMYMWEAKCENPNYYGTLTFGDMLIMTGNVLTSFDVNSGFWNYESNTEFAVNPSRDGIIVQRGPASGSTGRIYASLSGELNIHARLTDYYGIIVDPETGFRGYDPNVSFMIVETVGDDRSGTALGPGFVEGSGHAGTIVRQYDTLTVRPRRFFDEVGQRIITREEYYQDYGGPEFVLDRDVNTVYSFAQEQYNDQLLIANMIVKEDPFEVNGLSYNQRQTGRGLDQIYALRDPDWLPVLRDFWYREEDWEFQRALTLYSGEVRAHSMFMPVTDMWRFAYNRHDFRPCPDRARWMNPCYALYNAETFCDGNTGCDSNGNKTQPWQNHWNRIKRTVDAVKKDSVPWVSYIGDISYTRSDDNALVSGPETYYDGVYSFEKEPLRIIRDGIVVGFDKPFLRPGSYIGLQAAFTNADLQMYRAGAKSDDIQFGVYHGTILNNRWEWKNYLGMGVQDYRMWRTLDTDLYHMEAVPEHNTFYCYPESTAGNRLVSDFVGYTMSLNTEIAHPFYFTHSGKGKCGTTGRTKQYAYMLRPYGSLDVQGIWQSAASERWDAEDFESGRLVALDYRRTNHVRAYARYGFSAEWHNDNRFALRGGLAHAFLIGGRGYADVDNQFQFRKEETTSFNIRSTNGGNSYGIWNAGGSIFLFKDRSGTFFADYTGRADLRTVIHGVQVGFQKRY